MGYFKNLTLRSKLLVTYLLIFLSFVAILYTIAYLFVFNNLYDISSTTLFYFFISFVFVFVLLIVFVSIHFSKHIRPLVSYLDSMYKEVISSDSSKLSDDELDDIKLKLKLVDDRTKSRMLGFDKLSKDLFNLYDSFPVMLCITSLDGLIIDVNKAFANTLSLSKEKLLGKSFAGLLSHSTKERFENFFKEFCQGLSQDSLVSSSLGYAHKSSYLDLEINGLSFSSFVQLDVVASSSSLFDVSSYLAHDLSKSIDDVYFVRMSLIDIGNLLSRTTKDAVYKADRLSIAVKSVSHFCNSSDFNINTLSNLILENLALLIPYNLGVVLFSELEGSKDYSVIANFGFDNIRANITLKESLSIEGDDVLSKVILDKENLLTNHFVLKNIIEYNSLKELDTYDNIKDLSDDKTSLIIPLPSNGQELIGFIILDSLDRDIFDELGLSIVELFSSMFTSIIKGMLNNKSNKEHTKMQMVIKKRDAKDVLVKNELRLAGSIQSGILPNASYKWHGISIEAYYEAMGEIGGDYYDYFHLPQGELVVFTADVSGHGIPAALITSMAKISFISASQRFYTPKSILTEVNLDMCKYIKTDDYISVFFCILDKSFNITYANAGHQVALLFRRALGEVIALDTPGYFCGISEELGRFYEDAVTNFAYGDRLVLYTDGITETMNSDNEPFGVDRLKLILIDNASISIKELRDIIMKCVREFAGNLPAKDDISFVIIELDKEYEKVINTLSKGRENFKLGKYKESIGYFKKALLLDTSNIDIMLMLGEAHLRIFSFRDSIKYFNGYVKIKKNNVHAYYRLALACFKVNEYDESIEANKKALEVDKKFSKSLYVLGLTYKKIHDYKKARDYFEQLLIVEPDNQKAKDELSL